MTKSKIEYALEEISNRLKQADRIVVRSHAASRFEKFKFKCEKVLQKNDPDLGDLVSLRQKATLFESFFDESAKQVETLLGVLRRRILDGGVEPASEPDLHSAEYVSKVIEEEMAALFSEFEDQIVNLADQLSTARAERDDYEWEADNFRSQIDDHDRESGASHEHLAWLFGKIKTQGDGNDTFLGTLLGPDLRGVDRDRKASQ